MKDFTPVSLNYSLISETVVQWLGLLCWCCISYQTYYHVPSKSSLALEGESIFYLKSVKLQQNAVCLLWFNATKSTDTIDSPSACKKKAGPSEKLRVGLPVSSFNIISLPFNKVKQGPGVLGQASRHATLTGSTCVESISIHRKVREWRYRIQIFHL